MKITEVQPGDRVTFHCYGFRYTANVKEVSKIKHPLHKKKVWAIIAHDFISLPSGNYSEGGLFTEPTNITK